MYIIKRGNWRNSTLSNENPVIFTHPHDDPNRSDFLSPVEHKKRIVPVSLFIAVSPYGNRVFQASKRMQNTIKVKL